MNKHHWIIGKRQLVLGVIVLFLVALLIMIAAAALPYAYANAAAYTKGMVMSNEHE